MVKRLGERIELSTIERGSTKRLVGGFVWFFSIPRVASAGLVQPHCPVNVLKRPCAGVLVVVWAQSDQAKGVCEDVLAVWVQSKGQGPPCR